MIQIQKSMREAKQAMLRTFMETTIARVAKAVFAERGYQQAPQEATRHHTHEEAAAWSGL